jgi:MFS family permease
VRVDPDSLAPAAGGAAPHGAAAAEWKLLWPLVLTASLGFSLHAVAMSALGLFVEPLHQEFGWTHAQATAGLSVAAMLSIPLSPLTGAMVDRWGSRRLALAGIILTAASLASFGFANGSVVQWIALWSVYSVVTMGVKGTVWSAAVSSTFSAGRGLALAFTFGGVAVAQVFVPPLTYWLITEFGWRYAYGVLGAGWSAPVLVLAFFFLFDARDRARAGKHGATGISAADLPGLSLRQAVRSGSLIRIAITTFLMMLVGMAAIILQVPILTEAGVERSHAAMLAGLAGFASVAGKFVTGWLMDRPYAVRVSGLTILISAIAFALLLEPIRSPATIVAGMLMISYVGGAVLHFSAYLTSRYGGLRNFGKIYGVMAGLLGLGVGLGPLVASIVHDSFGSYTPFLVAGIPACIVCGILILGLRPFPTDEELRFAGQ